MAILICMRSLPYSAAAVRFGGLVAALWQSPVTLLTVVADLAAVPAAEAAMVPAGSMLASVPGRVTDITYKVRSGPVAEEILDEATDPVYRLIVLGANLVPSLLQVWSGGVTRRVAARSPAAVLVVKPPVDDPPQLRRILICAAGGGRDRPVVTLAADLAAPAGANVSVLHVADPIPAMYSGLTGMAESLDQLLRSDTPVARQLRWCARYLAGRQITGDLQLRHGPVVDEILREAAAGDYDLVVLGSSSRASTLRRLLAQPITQHLIENAPCSVLMAH